VPPEGGPHSGAVGLGTARRRQCTTLAVSAAGAETPPYGKAPMQADGGGDRDTASREPQREMTILEVLVSLMVFGTNGRGAIGAKSLVTVTTTLLPG